MLLQLIRPARRVSRRVTKHRPGVTAVAAGPDGPLLYFLTMSTPNPATRYPTQLCSRAMEAD